MGSKANEPLAAIGAAIRMAIYRITALATLWIGALWLQFVSTYPAGAYAMQALDVLDDRPAKRVLWIGNSRSFTNDMPAMVRAIADESGSAEKLQIVEHLLPGARLRDHWTNDRVHALLAAEPWDEIIIQAQSGAHFKDERGYFHDYGARLVRKAKDNAGTVRLLVTWTYDDADMSKTSRDTYHRRIQSDHKTLASKTGVELTNVGKIWEANRTTSFDFPLTTDGNHPTPQGSYIAALALYSDMAKTALDPIEYRPAGVSAEQAKRVQQRIAFHWQLAGDI